MDYNNYTAEKKYLVGVDSDGSALDSMGIKHFDSFVPAMIEIWNLECIAEEVTHWETKINLYCSLRGINRFPGLLKTFQYLKKHLSDTSMLPCYDDLEAFVGSGCSFSNAGITQYLQKHPSTFLEEVLAWSARCDVLFEAKSEDIRAFAGVKEALARTAEFCDIVVVSAATSASLQNDWGKSGLTDYVRCIAGQEFGNKKEQLRQFSACYDSNHIIMMGDGLSDCDAVKAHNGLFYPIIPGQEVDCWERWTDTNLEKFLEGEYTQQYEASLMDRLRVVLEVIE